MIESTRRAVVRLAGRRAGELTETVAGSRFIYDSDFPGEVALALPRAAAIHEWSGGLDPVFAHVTAEGWLRDAQIRAEHLDADDRFGLLLAYGGDCIGAIEVEAIDPRPAPPSPPTGVVDPIVSPGRTLSGQQRKCLARWRDEATRVAVPAGVTGPAPLIAKFEEARLPQALLNEQTCLELCRAVLGEAAVAWARIGFVAVGGEREERALLVRRFDRDANGAKRRFEEFAQILRRSPGPDGQGKYVGDYLDCAEIIRRFSAVPQVDLAAFFERLALAIALGNADAHLKNWGLIERAEGFRLAPVYDMLSTVIFPGYATTLALTLDGAKPALEAIDRPLLERFGKTIGLTPAAIRAAFARLAKLPPAIARIAPSAESELGWHFRSWTPAALDRVLTKAELSEAPP